MKKYIYSLAFLIGIGVIFYFSITDIFFGTYYVNKKSTKIGYIKLAENEKFVIDSILKQHTFLDDMDQDWKLSYKEMSSLPIQVEILYFSDNPEELIGVNFENKCIRYVYNPELHWSILNGLAKELNEDEKKRISSRIKNLAVTQK